MNNRTIIIKMDPESPEWKNKIAKLQEILTERKGEAYADGERIPFIEIGYNNNSIY